MIDVYINLSSYKKQGIIGFQCKIRKRRLILKVI